MSGAERPSSVTRKALLRRMLPGAAVALAAPVVHAQSPVEIVFYHWQTGPAGRSLRGLLDEFQAANPGITVRDVFRQSDQITADVQSVAAARRPLDLAQVLGRNAHFIMANLPVVPLNEDPAVNAWLDRFAPNFLGLADAGGLVYGMPHSFGTPMTYVNLDLLEQAGVDPAALSPTWEQVTAAAIAVRERTGRAGIAHIQTANRDYGVMTLVMNNGGEYLSPDGRRALFNSAEGIEALQLWGDLVARHRVHPVANDQQLTAAFRAGQIAIHVNTSAGLRPTIAAAEGRFRIGILRCPLFGAKPRRVPASGAVLMMFAPDGPRRAATLRLIEYVSRRDIANRWARETGYMPLSRDPLEDPAMARYAREFPLVQPTIAQMTETVQTAVWAPNGAIEAQTEVSNLISALWAGRGTAAELAPATVQRMNAILARLNPA
jgi:ABC-type glycerol-3-phosphate transport system substrate-binding protein